MPMLETWREKVTDDFTLVFDLDTPIYQAASSAEKTHVKIVLKETGEEFFKAENVPVMERVCSNPHTLKEGYNGKEQPQYVQKPVEGKFHNVPFKCKSDFYGMGKKVGGKLADINMEREAQGLPLYEKDDFEIETIKNLEPLSHAIHNLKRKLAEIQAYLGTNRCIYLLGKGECHRHQLEMPIDPKEPENPLRGRYKGRRNADDKPTHLEELQRYAMEQLGAKPVYGVECDDAINFYGWQSFQHYKKTGKHCYILISIDKDQKGFNCCLFDYQKTRPKTKDEKATWQYPYPYFIEGLGSLRMSGNKVKGEGQLWALTQLLIGDLETDGFSPTRYLGVSFGDGQAYKLLHDVKNVKEGFERALQQYADWFPEGVKFTSWTGKEIEMTWFEWANRIWAMLYMLKSEEDQTTLSSIVEALGIDVDAIKPYIPPKRTYVGGEKEEALVAVFDTIDEIEKSMVNANGLKSAERLELIRSVKTSLKALSESKENFYDMR